MSDELKPCPFCGADGGHSLAVGEKKYRTVGCTNEDCLFTRIFWERDEITQEQAIAAWNTRASTDAEWRALVEKLVGALKRASKCQFRRYYKREDGSSYLAGDDDAEYFVREALAEAKLRGVV